jgi:hypothetical protein
VDVVLPERAHEERLQVGARDRVRLLAGLGGDRIEREVAQDLAGDPVAVGHRRHVAAEGGDLVAQAEPVEHLDAVRPQRQRCAHGLVLAHPVVDDDVVAERRSAIPALVPPMPAPMMMTFMSAR